jgi:hypothetical protein
MDFTALHRLLGRQPGPLTADMLDDCDRRGRSRRLGLEEGITSLEGTAQYGIPHVAAMANSGGGVIVYGITENQKAAAGRHDIGEVDEAYGRTLRSATVTISPPIFG